MEELADALADWIGNECDCRVEPGLTANELSRAQEVFGLAMPPLWQAVLQRIHPVDLPVPPRSSDGVLRHVRYPDWRLRDKTGTRILVDGPVSGLLFDVEHSGFWWNEWGQRPASLQERLRVARDRLSAVPRLTPLRGHWYVGSTDDSPVFSIVQADLHVPAVTLADLLSGRSEEAPAVEDYPIGDVPFWSELHAYSQVGHRSGFGNLATGGLTS
jgi:hypothetical protein